jgi:hypothetical protein
MYAFFGLCLQLYATWAKAQNQLITLYPRPEGRGNKNTSPFKGKYYITSLFNETQNIFSI